MGDTSISWTDKTWNPVRGCSRVSEGCRHCYAETTAARFCDVGQPYQGLAKRTPSGPKWTGEVRFVAEHLADPLKWRKPCRVFVNSMSDLFHEKLTNEQIAAVFGAMAACPQHTFQILTKRATRMREWFEWMALEENWSPNATMHVETGPHLDDDDDDTLGERILDAEWPLPNAWLGVSVENQNAADERIPDLLATPAAVRFLSCEPLLGALDIRRHLKRDIIGTTSVDWVIAGCESGRGARVCDVDWLRSLRDQCRATGVPYFLKQAVQTAHECRESCGLGAVEADVGSKLKSGGVIELPYLDGVQHAEFPS